MRKVNYYKCPVCGMKYKSLGAWGNHLETIHPGTIPEGFTIARYFYFTLTGKTHGKCVQCGSETDWSESTQKYNRYCNNPKCKKEYVKLAKSRMIGKHGKEHLLNDPNMQRKMVAARHISGKYKFSDGSGTIEYVGSYEKDFLMMLDKFMGFKAQEIIAPSPNTYYYTYEGQSHFYIPDFFIPNLNLEIEIKQNTSTHPKILAVDKIKEKLKDEVMLSNPKINYIKIVDKDYKIFFEYLLSLKEMVDDTQPNQKITSDISSAIESVYNDGPEIDDEGGVIETTDCLAIESIIEATEATLFNSKDKADLNNYDKYPLTKDTIHEFRYKNRELALLKYTPNLDGYLYFDKTHASLAAMIICEKEDDIVFIKNIYLDPSLDGLGLYPQLIDVALRDFTATDIRIPKSDYKLKALYEARGFREYKVSGNFVSYTKSPELRQLKNGKKLKPIYIWLSTGKNAVAYFLTAFTFEQWTHASISFDTSMERLYTMCPKVWNDKKELAVGFNIETIRKFLRQDEKGNRYALYVKWVDDKTYKIIRDKLDWFVRNQELMKYDWMGILKMFANQRAVNDSNKYVCSNFVAAVLNADRNFTGGKASDMVRPGDLQKIDEAHLIDMDYFRNYDQKFIDKRVEEVYEEVYGKKRLTSKEHAVKEAALFEDLDLKFMPDEIKNYSLRSIISEATEESTMNFKMSDTAATESSLFIDEAISPSDNAPVVIYDDALEETVLKTKFDNVKVKGTLNLSNFSKVPITQQVKDKYKEQSASFDHVKLENSKGFLYTDKSDKIVGFVNVQTKNNVRWIQALNLQPAYQGYGLYEQLMKVAVKELGGTDISTPPKNDMAKEVYKKFGFKTYNDHETVHAMTIRKDAWDDHKLDTKDDNTKSSAVDNAKKDEANVTELKPVYIFLSYAGVGFGKFVKFMTHAPYSHASIGFDSGLTKMWTFAGREGKTMIPFGFAEESLQMYLKKAPECTYALYVYFTDPESYDMMKAKVKDFISRSTEFVYDVPGVVKTFFGMHNANDKRFFCSEFVSMILNSGKNGKVTQKDPDLMKPMDIPEVKGIHLVDMGKLTGYDKSFVDKRVNELKKQAIAEIRGEAKDVSKKVDDAKRERHADDEEKKPTAPPVNNSNNENQTKESAVMEAAIISSPDNKKILKAIRYAGNQITNSPEVRAKLDKLNLKTVYKDKDNSHMQVFEGSQESKQAAKDILQKIIKQTHKNHPEFEFIKLEAGGCDAGCICIN